MDLCLLYTTFIFGPFRMLMLGQNINCEENRPMAPGGAWCPSYFFTVCLKLTKKTLALLLKVTETTPQTWCQMLIEKIAIYDAVVVT